MLNKVLNKTEEIIEVEKFANNTILIDTVGDITSKNAEDITWKIVSIKVHS